MNSNEFKKIVKRLESLEKIVSDLAEKQPKKKMAVPNKLDQKAFSLNERAFVKRFASDKSGPKKFTLILAYLAKGHTSKDIERKAIETLWNKMSGKQFLGEFNSYYANQAKNEGYVNSKKRGIYSLSDEWLGALE